MGAIASQITSLTIVYAIVYSDADQRKHQSSASLAFVWGIRRGPVNSPHKWPVTRKMFPFDDIMTDDLLDPGGLPPELPAAIAVDQDLHWSAVSDRSRISDFNFCPPKFLGLPYFAIVMRRLMQAHLETLQTLQKLSKLLYRRSPENWKILCLFSLFSTNSVSCTCPVSL